MIPDYDYWIQRAEAYNSLRELNEEIALMREASWSEMDWVGRLVFIWLFMRGQPYEYLYERETLKQVRGWFCLSLVAALGGFSLIGTGAVVVMSGNAAVGLLTVVASAVPNTVAALFYANYKWANAQANGIYHKRLEERRRLQELEMVKDINDPVLRDDLNAYLLQDGLKETRSRL